MSDRVLILGASTRAAAASARRAGFTPFAVDLFADRDTAALCEYVYRCPLGDYPRGLFDVARRLPPMPWMYTGGLENYPNLVGELAAERELWGNGPDVLRQVRDPLRLSAFLSAKGLTHPEVRPGTHPPNDYYWLRKPLRGSGGSGIRTALPSDPPSAEHYYQKLINGDSYSAVGMTGRVLYCRQLVGAAWLHAAGWQYAGNLGPLELDSEFVGDTFMTAFRLHRVAELVGPFGIDFVHDGEHGYTVEVNPRYTASVEVHELATGVSLLRRADPPPPASRVVGKAVYYAAEPLTVPDSGPWDEALAHCIDVWGIHAFADIPRPRDRIEAGQPVITLLADGPSMDAVLATLKTRAGELDRLFGVPTPEDSP